MPWHLLFRSMRWAARRYESLVVRCWWIVLLVFAGAAAFFGPHAVDLKVDASTSAFLNDDDLDLAYYERTRPVWGYDETAIVCATRDGWIDPEGVKVLLALDADLKRVPHAKSTSSVLDLPLLRQKPGEWIVLDQVRYLASPGLDFDKAREEVLNHTEARAGLVSKDGRDLAVLVHLDVPEESVRLDTLESKWKSERASNPEAEKELDRLRPQIEAANERLSVLRAEFVDGLRRVAAEWTPRLGQPVRLSGTPFISVSLKEHIAHDLHVFVVASLVLFVLAFLVIYRRPRFVLLPILACALPALLVVGAMAWLGMGVTLNTANLPLLLFVLMLPYTVYFVEAYRERRGRYAGEPHATSVFEASRAIWTPCFYSCTTTMAGFASLLTSHTVPVHTFGMMMTIGMAVGLVTVFTALPAMSRPLPALTVASAGGAAREATGMVRRLATASLARPGIVVLGSLALFGVAAWGATKVTAESKFTEYFWPRSDVYQGLEYIDTRRGGTTPLEVVLESADKDFFLTQRGLDAIAAASRYFDTVPETGSVRSLATLVEELKKRQANVVQYLPLLARQAKVRDAARDLATEDFRVARIFVRMMETAPTLDRRKILDGLTRHLAALPELRGIDWHVTGIFLLYENMLKSLLESQKDTFVIVLVGIYAMLVVLFRSLVLAFLVVLPQVLPATVMLGIMGWFRVPLDLVTVIIASIAMGVGIDAAIQYTIRYRIELSVDGDRRAALLRSHATIGRAIWIATSIIVAGFGVLVLSDFKPTAWFGVFTAIAMLMSQFAALTTLPSIFLLTGYPKTPRTPKTP